MKKAVISIPVHEEPNVVENHLSNIKKFTNNVAVVLHASAHSGIEFYNQIKNLTENKFKDFAFLNNNSFDTYAPGQNANVTGLSTVHCSNFKYIDSIIEFDYFALETSNDMFVRRGVENLWEHYECGCNTSQHNTSACRNDAERNIINKISNLINLNTIEIHGPEGTFYPKEVFKEVSNIVIDKIGGFFGDEEIVLHTLAFNIDNTLYNKNCNSSYIYHDYRDAATKEIDILSVRNGDKNNKYAVKRVPRKINDHCRNFIAELTKND